MADYLACAKQLYDDIVDAGHSISEMELRHAVLDGLDSLTMSLLLLL